MKVMGKIRRLDGGSNFFSNMKIFDDQYQYEMGMAMNARESENYLVISRSSSASKSVEIFWAEIYWGRLFLGPNLVSFNRAVVPYEISKVNFHVETKILVSMSEEI